MLAMVSYECSQLSYKKDIVLLLRVASRVRHRRSSARWSHLHLHCSDRLPLTPVPSNFQQCNKPVPPGTCRVFTRHCSHRSRSALITLTQALNGAFYAEEKYEGSGSVMHAFAPVVHESFQRPPQLAVQMQSCSQIYGTESQL